MANGRPRWIELRTELWAKGEAQIFGNAARAQAI